MHPRSGARTVCMWACLLLCSDASLPATPDGSPADTLCVRPSVFLLFCPALKMKRVVTESGGNIITEVYVSVTFECVAFGMSEVCMSDMGAGRTRRGRR